MGDEMKRCPFCGADNIGVHSVGQVYINIYPDEAAEATAKALQVTAVAQCRACFAQVEDWARMLVPFHLIQGLMGAGAFQDGEHTKFTGEVNEKAHEMARLAWNRRV